jgi:hypothetical protein
MSIGFESEETTLRKLREQLHAMSDEELIAFGKYARGLAGFRISGTRDPFKVKLDEAIVEWRRRHHDQPRPLTMLDKIRCASKNSPNAPGQRAVRSSRLHF